MFWLSRDEVVIIRDALAILNPDNEDAEKLRRKLLYEFDIAILPFPKIKV
jgi:hypothetical protein